MSKFRKLIWILPVLMTPGMAQAVSIGFNLAAQPVTIGDTIMTDVVISGLGSGVVPSLSTFDLDVTFDDSHLSFVSTSFGSQLDLFRFGLGNARSDTLTGVGILNLFELSFDSPADLDALQADSFTLATLTFNVLTADSSTLGIVVNALGDSFGDLLAADADSARIVSVIPLPSAAWFFLTGLIGLSLSVRRKPKSRARSRNAGILQGSNLCVLFSVSNSATLSSLHVLVK